MRVSGERKVPEEDGCGNDGPWTIAKAAIPTFPQPRRGAEKWKTKSTFPTFPLTVLCLFLRLRKEAWRRIASLPLQAHSSMRKCYSSDAGSVPRCDTHVRTPTGVFSPQGAGHGVLHRSRFSDPELVGRHRMADPQIHGVRLFTGFLCRRWTSILVIRASTRRTSASSVEGNTDRTGRMLLHRKSSRIAPS